MYLTEAQRLSRTGSFGRGRVTGESFWSEEMYRIYQYEQMTKPTRELILQRVHPEDAALVKQTIERAAEDEKGFDFEHRLLMPDGSVKYLHAVAHVEKDKSGEIEFVGAVTDITAAKQAEAALQTSEQQWRDVFENNPTMYFMVDAGGTVMAVNPFGAEQLGYTVNEIVGQPVLGFFYEVDREAVQRTIAICLERLGQPMNWEFRKVRKNGSVLWVREKAKAVLRGNERVVLVACEDITEQKRAEEALHQTQAALAHTTRMTTIGELTASIAHEVNQPLSAVVNNANACLSFLPNGAPLLEEVRNALSEIIDDANRASAVIAGVRQLARKAPCERAPLDLRDVITDVLALARYESASRRVAICTELPEELPLVLGDRVQLQQVLLNLVVNGMDAMNTVEEAERVLIICGRCETRNGMPEALVSVQDAGTGFKLGEMDRLFEAFYTTKPEGMGMGLAISHSIIETHGGRLWAEPNQGVGATFLFSLPTAGNDAL